MPGEFELIKKYFAGRDAGDCVKLGVGDDCALMEIPQGQCLAVTTDTQVEGVHFFKGADPRDLGWKSLLVNLSDLAAMGARPCAFTLSLTLPEAEDAFLKPFSEGLFALAGKAQIPLIGGNTARGQLSVTISAYGLVKAGQALRRDAARAGDLVCVSGALGAPALAVEAGYGRAEVTQAQKQALLKKSMLIAPLNEPACEVAERGLCRCAIDISDGFCGDLGHILERSCLGAQVRLEALPLSKELYECDLTQERREDLALYGGGDYQLILVLPERSFPEAREIFTSHGSSLAAVGAITSSKGLTLMKNGRIHKSDRKGFEHF
ncbi:MAG: thiamine-phosphate kinase [Succinivibrio sp.]|jgi:thiamine-monophosphate kinase|nr:thiamine-phosphate kinase [Succinivibrio sp.]